VAAGLKDLLVGAHVQASQSRLRLKPQVLQWKGGGRTGGASVTRVVR
jgi:hypothetical protein